MKVIIAEKPSVAKNIADALGIKKRQDGYFEGSEYCITWAFGHLLELYDAKDYDEKMGLWRMENFPFIPNEFKYKIKTDRSRKKPDPGAKKQLKCIKDLINKKEVDGVISATDYDREGQIIGDTILNYLKVKKPTYRILLNEWTEDEVKKGIEKMVSNDKMKPLQDAGISRQHADWMIGINLTSVATLRYKAAKGEVFNIGRVLLPTLKMIYDRDLEIEKFNPEPYHKLVANLDYSGRVFDATYTLDKKDKFEDKSSLDDIAKQIEGKKATLVDKDTIEKNEYPQPLFNLSALQGYITSKYTGFTSDKVLKVAQSLYESKYITYPRTASSVLDESLVGKAKKVLDTVKVGLSYENEVVFKKLPRVFNSKKVESHSAIMPTYVIPKNLGRDEKLVYEAVKNRFIMQFMPIAKAEETTLITHIEGVEGDFIAKGKVQKELGWKKVENDMGKDTILPDIEKGEVGRCEKSEVTSHATKPPKPYTEKTLLRAMETCGKQFKNDRNRTEDENEDETEDRSENDLMDAILSGFSIGTPATRAETIKKLCYTGYTVMQKKNIRCTDKGKKLIEILPVKGLMDLEYTGKLEKTLSDMEKGEVSKDDFLNHIQLFVKEGVESIRYQKQVALQTYTPQPISTKENNNRETQGNKQQTVERQVLGSCPHCAKDVVEGKENYGCLGYKEGCTYVIPKMPEELKKYGKKTTKTMVKGILKKGETTVKGLKTPKGTVFDAVIGYQYDKQSKKGEWLFKPVK